MYQCVIILNREYKRVSKKFKYYTKYKKLLPINPQHNDVYLVGYPKSGITWLSYLLGNINLIKSNLQQRMTYYNHHQYIPDIHVSRKIKKKILPFPGFRMIKSHSAYNPFYDFVILLIRNPFDVIVSYYYFMKSLNLFQGDLMSFIKDNKYGIDAWVTHLSSWIDKPTDAQRLYLLRYEDLKANTFDEVKQLYKIIGFKIEDKVIEKAIGFCSFERMKKDETFYRARNPNYNLNFIRKGKSNEFSSEMNKEMINYISERCGSYLERFYSDLQI